MGAVKSRWEFWSESPIFPTRSKDRGGEGIISGWVRANVSLPTDVRTLYGIRMWSTDPGTRLSDEMSEYLDSA